MGDLSEQAKSLLEVLQTCHEEADLKEPYIKHFLKKLTDGRIEITEQNTDQYIQILKELRTTLIELSTSVNKLTKLVDDGLKLLETFEDKPQSCKSLKPASYENDDNLLVAELRDQKTRVSTDSAIGSIGSNISSRSEFDDNRQSSASPTEHADDTGSGDHTNDLATTSSIREQRVPGLGLDFQNLSMSSLQSNSCNEETNVSNEEVDVRWDQKIGPVSSQPPERDSVAFANTIESDERSFIESQGRAVHGETRHQNIIVMKDDYYGEKDCDV